MDTMKAGEAVQPKLQNIAVPEDLHRLLKARAAREGKKIRELVWPKLWELAKPQGVAK